MVAVYHPNLSCGVEDSQAHKAQGRLVPFGVHIVPKFGCRDIIRDLG